MRVELVHCSAGSSNGERPGGTGQPEMITVWDTILSSMRSEQFKECKPVLEIPSLPRQGVRLSPLRK